jgi:hypothetical protein
MLSRLSVWLSATDLSDAIAGIVAAAAAAVVAIPVAFAVVALAVVAAIVGLPRAVIGFL